MSDYFNIFVMFWFDFEKGRMYRYGFLIFFLVFYLFVVKNIAIYITIKCATIHKPVLYHFSTPLNSRFSTSKAYSLLFRIFFLG